MLKERLNILGVFLLAFATNSAATSELSESFERDIFTIKTGNKAAIVSFTATPLGKDFYITWIEAYGDSARILGTVITTKSRTAHSKGCILSTLKGLIPKNVSMASDPQGRNVVVIWTLLYQIHKPIKRGKRTFTVLANYWEIQGILLSRNKGFSKVFKFQISDTTMGWHTIPHISWGKEGYLITWNSKQGIQTVLFDPQNNTLSNENLVISSNRSNGIGPPLLSWNGTHFLLLWEQNDKEIRGIFLNERGFVKDTGNFLIWNKGCNELAVIWNGNNHFVVWSENSEIYGIRISSSGLLLDTLPILISSEPFPQFRPCILWDGNRYLVMWYEDCYLPKGWGLNNQIVGKRIDESGQVLDSLALRLVDSPLDRNCSYFIWNGKYLLVVSMQRSEISAKLFKGTSVIDFALPRFVPKPPDRIFTQILYDVNNDDIEDTVAIFRKNLVTYLAVNSIQYDILEGRRLNWTYGEPFYNFDFIPIKIEPLDIERNSILEFKLYYRLFEYGWEWNSESEICSFYRLVEDSLYKIWSLPLFYTQTEADQSGLGGEVRSTYLLEDIDKDGIMEIKAKIDVDVTNRYRLPKHLPEGEVIYRWNGKCYQLLHR